jgi:hypothetical protein
MVKNPQANAILERMQVLGQMLHTLELDMADSVSPNDVNVSRQCSLDNLQYLSYST